MGNITKGIEELLDLMKVFIILTLARVLLVDTY